MKFLDWFEGKGKWAFYPWLGLWIWVVLTLVISIVRCSALGLPPITSASIALFGAIMACLGAFTIARPVIRAGGYRSWYEKQRGIDGGSFQPSAEELREAEEGAKDSLAVNIVGPALAICGTLLNGLSGFFPT